MSLFFSSILILFSTSSSAEISKNSWRPEIKSIIEILKITSSEERNLRLSEQPDSVYSTLLQIQSDEKQIYQIRWKALIAAAARGKSKAIPDLLKVSRSKDWYMRNASLLALQNISREEAAKLAETYLEDPAYVVRTAAAKVLVEHGSLNQRKKIWSLVKNDKMKNGPAEWLRLQYLQLLVSQPKLEDKSALESLRQDRDPEIKKIAQQALLVLTY